MLEQNDLRLMRNMFEEILDKRFAEQDARIDEKFEKRFAEQDARIDEKSMILQMHNELEKRVARLEEKVS